MFEGWSLILTGCALLCAIYMGLRGDYLTMCVGLFVSACLFVIVVRTAKKPLDSFFDGEDHE